MASTDSGFRRFMVAAFLVAWIGLAPAASASVLRGLTLEELHDRADAVVTGTVLAVRSGRGGNAETVARVRVDRSWRGTDSRTVLVRVPGATRGTRRIIVPGAPVFREGEQVVLFLSRDGGEWRPVGLFQGVWRLDPERPRVARASDSGGAAVIRPDSGTAAVESPEYEVQDLVRRPGGAR